MEIMFSMKLKPDGKTVAIEMRCADCKSELEMAQSAAEMRFRCRKHGELGTLTPQEFADGLRQAQEKAAQQYGLSGLKQVRMVGPEPTVQ
ncbi:MAG TPA: hypothetical protein VE783_01085 [Candidatus Limnocylindrales bacterium]|jgi:hypothetical protein|nr:hypothetical protein [Candidatus Limnocylindrales bacterium]